MSTHSKDGREWARLSNLKPGSIIKCDDGFTCGINNQERVVGADASGKLFVNCGEGRHYLDGQLASEGIDGGDTDHLVGMWPA